MNNLQIGFESTANYGEKEIIRLSFDDVILSSFHFPKLPICMFRLLIIQSVEWDGLSTFWMDTSVLLILNCFRWRWCQLTDWKERIEEERRITNWWLWWPDLRVWGAIIMRLNGKSYERVADHQQQQKTTAYDWLDVKMMIMIIRKKWLTGSLMMIVMITF